MLQSLTSHLARLTNRKKGRYLSRRNIPSKGPPLFYILIQQSTVHKAKSSQSLLKACNDAFVDFVPFPILVSFLFKSVNLSNHNDQSDVREISQGANENKGENKQNYLRGGKT